MATDTSNKSTGASSMAELMSRQTAQPIALKKGDVVKGTITKLTRAEILVDINAKSEAIAVERDKRLLNRVLDIVKEGDVITVTVLNPESDMGTPLVSMRRFIEDISWKELEEQKKNGDQIEVTVQESTKGGYVVSMDNGLSGFLPFSHASFLQTQQPAPGSKIRVSVLELNKQDNKIIFSQKRTMTDDKFNKIAKTFSSGQAITVTVANVTTFGIFVLAKLQAKEADKETKTIDGLIHISEIAWEKVDDISGLYKTGDPIEAVVIGFDRDARRINLSIKRLTLDPFEETIKEFPVDKKATGTVTKVAGGNIHVALTEDLEGVIRKEKVPPTTIYAVGQAITVTVAGIDRRRHRIDLVPVLLEKPIGYR